MGGQGSSFFVGPDSQPDKYRLLQQVGGGGEAQLWQADLPVAGGQEPVAVKVLRPERMGEFGRLSARWAEQAELLLFVRHPGVVGVREHFEGAPMHLPGPSGEPSGRSLYLVMNWVDGRSLREFVALGGGTREATLQVLRNLEQVAEVLDWLHSGRATPSNRAVVHGDLSAGNVMISPAGQAVLVDFGLVRLVAHQTQEAAGTPGYAAPEVWLSGQYSPAGDRYGFGAITCFALTGTDPTFDTSAIRAGFLSNPLVAGAPPHAIDQIMEMFSDDPARRPPAVPWIRLLRNTATTTGRRQIPPAPPTQPRPPATQPPAYAQVQPDPPQPAMTWRRRGRRLAWATAGVVAVLVAGVVLGATVLGGGGSGATAAPGPTTAPVPTTVPALPTTTPRTTSPGQTLSPGAITPAEVEIRRQSGGQPLRLTPGTDADLDSLDPDWETVSSDGGADLQLFGNGIFTEGGARFVPVIGAADFATCQRATGPVDEIDLDESGPGITFCVQTTDDRYAHVTVLDPNVPVQLDVVVWDPPRR